MCSKAQMFMGDEEIENNKASLRPGRIMYFFDGAAQQLTCKYSCEYSINLKSLKAVNFKILNNFRRLLKRDEI